MKSRICKVCLFLLPHLHSTFRSVSIDNQILFCAECDDHPAVIFCETCGGLHFFPYSPRRYVFSDKYCMECFISYHKKGFIYHSNRLLSINSLNQEIGRHIKHMNLSKHYRRNFSLTTQNHLFIPIAHQRLHQTVLLSLVLQKKQHPRRTWACPVIKHG